MISHSTFWELWQTSKRINHSMTVIFNCCASARWGVARIFVFIFFFNLIYFLERGERRETERKRNTDVWNSNQMPLVQALNWGSGLQSRHVSWLGIELSNFQFTGWCSAHWVTPARVARSFKTWCPRWCGSVDSAPAWKPKGCRFNSQSGHMPGL